MMKFYTKASPCYSDGNVESSNTYNLTLSKEKLAGWLISISILSTFIPIKVYPAFFLATSVFLLLSHKTVPIMTWGMWLWSFVGYSLLITLLIFTFQLTPISSIPSFGLDELANFVKLVINSLFLVSAVGWIASSSGNFLRLYIDRMLHVVFFLALAQLLVYIVGAGGMVTTDTSSAAAAIYNTRLCFWFTADKNIFGARIALFGFLYMLSFFIHKQRLPVYRSGIVSLCAFLSNSRTPIAALAIGVVYLLFRRFRWRGRLLLVAIILAVAPFVALKLLRVTSFTQSDDGMGIRLIYWYTFVSRFTELPIFGTGFMSASRFLSRYSPIYLGEPHLHNIFLNNYLDFGFPGAMLYLAFLVSFYRFCLKQKTWFLYYWTASFLPMLAIMATLSAPYDSDTAVYFVMMFLIGRSGVTKPVEAPSYLRSSAS